MSKNKKKKKKNVSLNREELKKAAHKVAKSQKKYRQKQHAKNKNK